MAKRPVLSKSEVHQKMLKAEVRQKKVILKRAKHDCLPEMRSRIAEFRSKSAIKKPERVMRHSLALHKNLGQLKQDKFNQSQTYHFKLHDKHEQRENRLRKV